MERRKFEDSFKDAFKDAEINPSEEVWTNIELELEKADGGKVRRTLFFYKMLAAASITFALAFAGIGYYILDNKTKSFNNQLTALRDSANNSVNQRTATENSLAQDQHPSSDRNNDETPEANNAATQTKSGIAEALKQQPLTANDRGKKVDGLQAKRSARAVRSGLDDETGEQQAVAENQQIEDSQNQKSPNTTSAIAQGNDAANGVTSAKVLGTASSETNQQVAFGQTHASDAKPFEYASRKLPAIYTQKKPELIVQSKPDAVAVMMERLKEIEKQFASEEKKDKDNSSEKLWTSVGFAAGGFNAVNANTSSVPSASFLSASNSSVPDKQAKASGVAYSFGVSVGTKIAKRWVLQGGVNYLSQSSDYVATNVVADANLQGLKAESINELDKLPQLSEASNNKLAPTVPYSVNNNLQFFSVPVQAGYLIVNKKFGLQLNGGVSTDLFVQNTITPQGGSLDKSTQGRGDDSPYRAVNFSGLMGTELSYRFGTRYRVSLNPGLRYPLNSVYKSDVGIQSTPLTFDVGLRFRYIFH